LIYDDQLKAKSEILQDQLARIGGLIDIPITPIIASQKPWNYRNHIQFHLTRNGDLGFLAPRSDVVIPIKECHLPENSINELWPQLDIEPTPGLERVSLRVGTNDELMLILESNDPHPIEFSVEEISISAVHLGPGGALVLAGSEYINIDLNDHSFRLSPDSFFQVNTTSAAILVEQLLEHLPLTPGSSVLDIYCGVGLFSAFIAPHVAEVISIEVSPSSCEDFTYNLDEFENITLFEAAAGDVLSEFDFHPDVIIVDPPRSGIDIKALDGIMAQDAPYLAYVSCDPATFSRDARRISEGGYHLELITPIDLFPQTFHIESISFWSR
jgi:23S rRNA (uracil1939-C5)-methyltransferase